MDTKYSETITYAFERIYIEKIYTSVKLISVALSVFKFKEASSNSLNADDVDTIHYIIK